MLLAAFVASVTLIVAAAEYTVLAPGRSSPIESTLVIDFGTDNPSFMPGHTLNFTEAHGEWSYTVSNSSVSEYIFSNVNITNDNVWSLMQASSIAMKSATGVNITFKSSYFPSFGESLITGIQGVNNTSTLFWQYTVNGQPALYGVQLEKLKQGDVVVWSMSPA